jgi:antitoxin MazE
MKSIIRKWGSHTALLLPASSIEEAGYRVGQRVEVNVSRGCIVIRPLEKLEYELDALVGSITDANSHDEVRFDEPVAQLAPASAKPKSLFGYMSNTVTITGDVVAPTGEHWSADSGGREPLLILATKKKPRVRRAGSKKLARGSPK